MRGSWGGMCRWVGSGEGSTGGRDSGEKHAGRGPVRRGVLVKGAVGRGALVGASVGRGALVGVSGGMRWLGGRWGVGVGRDRCVADPPTFLLPGKTCMCEECVASNVSPPFSCCHLKEIVCVCLTNIN